MYQPRRHLSLVHTANYMPSIREKDGFLKKIIEANMGEGGGRRWRSFSRLAPDW